MPKELFEIKYFGKGIVGNASESDIPPQSATYSEDVESIDLDGLIRGRKDDEEVPSVGVGAGTLVKSPSLLESTDKAKQNLVFTDDNHLYSSSDMNSANPTNEFLKSNISPSSLNAVQNNVETHIGLGSSPSHRPLWVGYNKVDTWGSIDDSNIIVEDAECQNYDNFSSMYKTIVMGDYIYGIGYDGATLYKFDIAQEKLVATSSVGTITASTAMCVNDTGNDSTSRIYVYDDKGAEQKYLLTFDTGLQLRSTNKTQLCNRGDSDAGDGTIPYPEFGGDTKGEYNFVPSDMIRTENYFFFKWRNYDGNPSDVNYKGGLKHDGLTLFRVKNNFTSGQEIRPYYFAHPWRGTAGNWITNFDDWGDGGTPPWNPTWNHEFLDESLSAAHIANPSAHRGLVMAKSDLNETGGTLTHRITAMGDWNTWADEDSYNSLLRNIEHSHTNLCFSHVGDGTKADEFVLYTTPRISQDKVAVAHDNYDEESIVCICYHLDEPDAFSKDFYFTELNRKAQVAWIIKENAIASNYYTYDNWDGESRTYDDLPEWDGIDEEGGSGSSQDYGVTPHSGYGGTGYINYPVYHPRITWSHFDADGNKVDDENDSNYDYKVQTHPGSIRAMMVGQNVTGHADNFRLVNIVNTYIDPSAYELYNFNRPEALSELLPEDGASDPGYIAFTQETQTSDIGEGARMFWNCFELPRSLEYTDYISIWGNTTVNTSLYELKNKSYDSANAPADSSRYEVYQDNAGASITLAALWDETTKLVTAHVFGNGSTSAWLKSNMTIATTPSDASHTPSIATLALKEPVSFTFSDVDQGSGEFLTSSFKKYYYKYSLLYDNYQESPLSIERFTGWESGVNADTSNTNITITINNPLESLNKRINAIRLYRAESHKDLSSPDTLFRLVGQIPFDTSWDDVGINKVKTFRDTLYSVTSTYEAATGMSELMFNTIVNRGLSTELNNVLFAADCYHKEIPGAELYLFKSMPFKYDIFDWSKDFLILPQRPIALEAFNGRIYVFTKDLTLIVDPNTFYIEDTYKGFGIQNKDAVAISEYGMCYADRNNVYLHNGKQPVEIGTPILENLYDSTAGYKELYSDDFDMKVEYDSVNQSFLIFVSNEKFYSYNLMSKRWDLNNAKTNSVLLSTLYTNAGVIYWCVDSSVVKGYKVGTSSTRKSWTWVSKMLTFGQQSQDKKIYRLDIPYKGTAPTINHGYDGDTVDDSGDDDSTLPVGDGFGLASKKIKDKKRSIQVKLAGSADTIVESIGVIIRRMFNLTKAS
tara:strand:+ start:22 stop:3819 length:3798 start_codon:yes stop_codon:yes gene_type:complete